jgi:hypothetical protein
MSAPLANDGTYVKPSSTDENENVNNTEREVGDVKKGYVFLRSG